MSSYCRWKKCHSVQNFIAVLLPALSSPDYHGVMGQGLPALGRDSGRAGICRELFKYWTETTKIKTLKRKDSPVTDRYALSSQHSTCWYKVRNKGCRRLYLKQSEQLCKNLWSEKKSVHLPAQEVVPGASCSWRGFKHSALDWVNGQGTQQTARQMQAELSAHCTTHLPTHLFTTKNAAYWNLILQLQDCVASPWLWVKPLSDFSFSCQIQLSQKHGVSTCLKWKRNSVVSRERGELHSCSCQEKLQLSPACCLARKHPHTLSQVRISQGTGCLPLSWYLVGDLGEKWAYWGILRFTASEASTSEVGLHQTLCTEQLVPCLGYSQEFMLKAFSFLSGYHKVSALLQAWWSSPRLMAPAQHWDEFWLRSQIYFQHPKAFACSVSPFHPGITAVSQQGLLLQQHGTSLCCADTGPR